MIYFMAPTTGGAVKIGHTEDVGRRHKQLEARYGRELVILATMPGGPDEEGDLHSRFAHLRLGRTEQFRPGADLMTFIGRPLLVGANPDAVESMAGRPLDGKPVRLDLDPELHRRLRVVAAEQGKPMAVFAREVVEETVNRLYDERRGAK